MIREELIPSKPPRLRLPATSISKWPPPGAEDDGGDVTEQKGRCRNGEEADEQEMGLRGSDRVG